MRGTTSRRQPAVLLLRAGLGAAACLLVVAGSLAALPRPMKPAELLRASDVVAKVRVLAVACTGQAENKRNDQKLPTYQAWLQILSVTKGKVKENETVLVYWQEVPRVGIGGAPPVRYTPGEEVQTHLKWDANRRVYASTYYNAKGKPVRAVANVKLPDKPGQVLTAEPARREPIKE